MSIVKLAKMAGVSKATVSRVLNGFPRVSPEVTEAVLKAVEEAGYQRPQSNVGRPRRAPAGIRKGSVAFVFPDIDQGVLRTVLSGRLLHGLEEVFRQHRVGLQVTGLPAVDRLPAVVEERSVDGVILRGLGLNSQHIESLSGGLGRIPCVHLLQPKHPNFLPPTCDVVLENNDEIARLAFEYLIARGRRRLAVINPMPEHPSLQQRIRAFQLLAAEASIRVTVVVDASPVELLVEQALREGKPDGIFLPLGDDVTVAAYRALCAAGRRPFEALDLISSNNDAARLATLDERLANIDIQAEAIGRAAANMLLSRLRVPNEPSQRLAIAPALMVPQPPSKR